MTISITDKPAFDMLTAFYADLGGAGGGYLLVFGGTVPANAAAASTGATLLATLGNGNSTTPSHFDAPTTGTPKTLNKKSTEAVWNTTLASNVTGTATFFRYVAAADAGTAADGSPSTLTRIQGTIGVGGSAADMIVPTTAVVNGTDYQVSTFFASLPQAV